MISSNAHSAVQIGTDLFYSGFGYIGHGEVYLKSHSFVFFGTDSILAGPIFLYQRNRQESYEEGVGGAVRFGTDSFFEIGGGTYRLVHFAEKFQGQFITAIFGWAINNVYRLTLPITYTNVSSDSSGDIWRGSFVPHIGLQFVF